MLFSKNSTCAASGAGLVEVAGSSAAQVARIGITRMASERIRRIGGRIQHHSFAA